MKENKEKIKSTQLLLDKIINTNKSELIVLVGKILSGKTTITLNLLKNTIKKDIPTLYFGLETPKGQTINYVLNNESDEKKLNELGVFLGNTCYIENICTTCRKLKQKSNIELIIIDGICNISTKENYVLGRGDIVSIIIQELKKLSQELNVTILITAPCNMNSQEFEVVPTKTLQYFCKEKTAKDFIDRIIFIDGNIGDNNISFIQRKSYKKLSSK